VQDTKTFTVSYRTAKGSYKHVAVFAVDEMDAYKIATVGTSAVCAPDAVEAVNAGIVHHKRSGRWKPTQTRGWVVNPKNPTR
jgi:hypothetical protein